MMNIKEFIKEMFGTKTRTIITLLIFGSGVYITYLLGINTREWQIDNGHQPANFDLPFWVLITIYWIMNYFIAFWIGLLIWAVTVTITID